MGQSYLIINVNNVTEFTNPFVVQMEENMITNVSALAKELVENIVREDVKEIALNVKDSFNLCAQK